MFKWMIPVSKNLEHKHYCTEKADINIISDESLKVNLTPACQFFAYSSYILQTDVYISIPTPNKEAEKLVLDQLTPHYKRIIKASIGDQACQYNLIGLKPETIALFQKYENTDKLCSILPDIVRSNHIKQLDEKYFEDANIKEFAIDMDVLKPLNLPETESVYQFLKQTFFTAAGYMPTQPMGWKLQSDLIDSIFLRSVSTFASNIHITVNLSNGDILGVDIYQ